MNEKELETERENEAIFQGGRRPTKGLSGTEETEQLCRRDRDKYMSRQNRKECDQISRTEARVLTVFWERMICLWNSDKEITILLLNSSILNQPSTTTVNGWTEIAEKQTEFIVTRNRNDRRKEIENRTVIQQGIKISWHPHHAIYPCELRDWSLLSWHPHYAICLLRWWVSEGESTRITRERLL